MDYEFTFKLPSGMGITPPAPLRLGSNRIPHALGYSANILSLSMTDVTTVEPLAAPTAAPPSFPAKYRTPLILLAASALAALITGAMLYDVRLPGTSDSAALAVTRAPVVASVTPATIVSLTDKAPNATLAAVAETALQKADAALHEASLHEANLVQAGAQVGALAPVTSVIAPAPIETVPAAPVVMTAPVMLSPPILVAVAPAPTAVMVPAAKAPAQAAKVPPAAAMAAPPRAVPPAPVVTVVPAVPAAPPVAAAPVAPAVKAPVVRQRNEARQPDAAKVPKAPKAVKAEPASKESNDAGNRERIF